MLLTGKTISILGDSISTFMDITSGIAADRTNSTIRKNDIYYKEGTWGVTLDDTWWMQAIHRLDLRLLVNNAWSGSCVYKEHHGTVGIYVDRCVQLHPDVGEHAGEEPDLIAVFMGTNDFTFYRDLLGSSQEIDYSSLIISTSHGYSYAEPTTVCQAYAIALHKMRTRYPDAEIFCLNLLPRRADNSDGIPQPTAFNKSLADIVSHFGCHTVDLFHCGISTEGEEFDQYFPDQRVHPNVRGMTAIADTFVSTVEMLYSTRK